MTTPLSEHPHALDLNRRIEASPEKAIPAMLLLTGMPQLMGSIRKAENTNPGLFIIKANVKIGDRGEDGLQDFTFCADRVVAICYPEIRERSGLVSPHTGRPIPS